MNKNEYPPGPVTKRAYQYIEQYTLDGSQRLTAEDVLEFLGHPENFKKLADLL